MKKPLIQTLYIPAIINTASCLELHGKLAISENKMIYLDIDDEYVHQLFPLLKNTSAKMPDYFGEKSAGAHITVIYPEENIKIDEKDLGVMHHFTFRELVTAEIGAKTYYVVLVDAPSLLQLRRDYQLTDHLNFKGYAIGFHITIGVKN